MGTKPDQSSRVLKLTPRAKMPTDDVLANYSASEQCLLKRLTVEPVECVFHAMFEDEALAPQLTPAACRKEGRKLDNDDSGVDFLLGADEQVLEVDDERRAFVEFNYTRFRVYRTLTAAGRKRLTAEQADDLLMWGRYVASARNELVRSNVPLVLAMVKRTRMANVDYADLISEGNLALLRSVDKFDCARGYRFSTYACRAILKSFARVATRTARYRGHFPVEFDPMLEKSDALDRKRATVEDDCMDELRHVLSDDAEHLTNVERKVITARFAISEQPGVTPPDAKTLEQVGEMIGVTKERVRQIQNKALGKLRTVLDSGVLNARVS